MGYGNNPISQILVKETEKGEIELYVYNSTQSYTFDNPSNPLDGLSTTHYGSGIDEDYFNNTFYCGQSAFGEFIDNTYSCKISNFIGLTSAKVAQYPDSYCWAESGITPSIGNFFQSKYKWHYFNLSLSCDLKIDSSADKLLAQKSLFRQTFSSGTWQLTDDFTDFFNKYPSAILIFYVDIILATDKNIYLVLSGFVPESGTVKRVRSVYFLCSNSSSIDVFSKINLAISFTHYPLSMLGDFKIKINDIEMISFSDMCIGQPLDNSFSIDYMFMFGTTIFSNLSSTTDRSLIDSHLKNEFNSKISSFSESAYSAYYPQEYFYLSGTEDNPIFTSVSGSTVINGKDEYDEYVKNLKQTYRPDSFIDNLQRYSSLEAPDYSIDLINPITITSDSDNVAVEEDLIPISIDAAKDIDPVDIPSSISVSEDISEDIIPISIDAAKDISPVDIPTTIDIKEDIVKDLLNPIEVTIGKDITPVDPFEITVEATNPFKPIEEIEEYINKTYLGTQQAAEDFQLLYKVTEYSYWPVDFSIDNNYHIHIKKSEVYLGATLYACTNKQFLYGKYVI